MFRLSERKYTTTMVSAILNYIRICGGYGSGHQCECIYWNLADVINSSDNAHLIISTFL
jgi:hypothetical protein